MNEFVEPRPGGAAALAGVVPVSLWLQGADVAPVFSSDAAWSWFRKEHLQELVERGGLLLGAGRRGDMATADLDGIVREIMQRESINRLQRQAGRSVAGIAAGVSQGATAQS